MSEGSEIAAAPHRAVTRHHRGDLRVERGDERFGHRRAHTGKAHRKSASPEQHRRPHYLAIDWRADARRGRTYQGGLQLPPAEGPGPGSRPPARTSRNPLDGVPRRPPPFPTEP